MDNRSAESESSLRSLLNLVQDMRVLHTLPRRNAIDLYSPGWAAQRHILNVIEGLPEREPVCTKL